MASSLLELKLKGAEKLNLEKCNISELRVLLEADGTEIEDDGYFQTAGQDTVFLLVGSCEKWMPPGVEALNAGMCQDNIWPIICSSKEEAKRLHVPTHRRPFSSVPVLQ